MDKIKSSIKSLKSRIDYLDLFLPILNNFKSVNFELDEQFIANNNWDLLNDEDKLKIVMEKINLKKHPKDDKKIDNNLIVL